MAKNLKTIKFGENGETYAVNAPVVSVNEELTEAGTNIDFGSFEDGLTEVEVAVKGVAEASGDYFFITINGKQSGFITFAEIYTSTSTIRIKKVGSLWTVISNITATTFMPYILSLLDGVDKITSISLQAYSEATPFAIGTQYALEGR